MNITDYIDNRENYSFYAQCTYHNWRRNTKRCKRHYKKFLNDRYMLCTQHYNYLTILIILGDIKIDI